MNVQYIYIDFCVLKTKALKAHVSVFTGPVVCLSSPQQDHTYSVSLS